MLADRMLAALWSIQSSWRAVVWAYGPWHENWLPFWVLSLSAQAILSPRLKARLLSCSRRNENKAQSSVYHIPCNTKCPLCLCEYPLQDTSLQFDFLSFPGGLISFYLTDTPSVHTHKTHQDNVRFSSSQQHTVLHLALDLPLSQYHQILR